MGLQKRSGLRRLLRGVLWLLLVAVCGILTLRGLAWLGEKVPMIEEVGPEVVDGRLSLTPILFAQTDFWFYPPQVDAELGQLRVPARRDHPHDASVAIRWVRFAARGDRSAATPIVYLAGGPGGSGVYTASGDRFPFFMKLREAGDVIALDQRGVQTVDPAPRCSGAWSYPLDREVGADELIRAHRPVLRDCWDEWSGTIHPDSFTTVESAADLEDLRVAIGAKQLNLVGISYGTHLALAYIRAYPHRVGRAVLAGVEGPDHTYKRPAIVDGVVREIGRALEEQTGWVGFVTDVEEGIERLSREKPRVTIRDSATGSDVEVALGSLDLKTAVLYGLGERDDFMRAARRVRRIARGDYAELAKFTLRLRQGGSPSLLELSMDCASGASPERFELIAREEPGSLIGEAINMDLTTICPYWAVVDLGDAFRAPLQSRVPVLAVSGTLDSRTPPANAEEALAGFANATHLTLVGAGHSDDLLIGTPKIAEAMVAYLLTGKVETDRIDFPPL